MNISFFNIPRWLQVLMAISLLVISAYWLWKGEMRSYEQKIYKLTHPSEYTGEPVCVGYIHIDQKTEFGVSGSDKSGNRYHFKTEKTELQPGERYSVSGTILADGKIDVTDVQHHPHRRLKYGFSLLSVFLVFYLVLKYVRFEVTSYSFYLSNLESGLFGIGKRR